MQKNIRARLDGPSKIISLPVSKKWKKRFPIFIRKAVFFALFGVGHPRWGDFEKSALKSPETLMNTEKNRGDIYFVTPSWEGVTKLLSSGLIPFGINLLNKNQKELPTKWESPVQDRYILLFLQHVFLLFAFWCPISIKRGKPRKTA